MPKQDDKPAVFAALRKTLAPYGKKLAVTADSETDFSLDTHHIMKNKKPLFFGAVQIRKNYVSYHLMPVYVAPDLLDGVSDGLRKRMQGKSCFNFRAVDKGLFKELTALTKAGYQRYADEGYV